MRRFGVTLGAIALGTFLSATAFGQINLGGGGKGGDGGRGGNRGGGDGGAARIESRVNANVQGGNRGNDGNRGGDGNRSAARNNSNDNDRRDNDNDRGSNRDRDGVNFSTRDGLNIGGREGVNLGGARGGVNIGGRNGVNIGRDGRDYIGRSRIGDTGWDRYGIGRLDDNRYRNYRGNQWRYQRYGSDWFYWMPAGYWMFYGNGRWNRYDPDTYATYYYGDNYVQPQQAVQANFNGPFYEDSNGFYYLNGSERVYDPSIQRVANATGPTQR